jgi:hypothetical protein
LGSARNRSLPFADPNVRVPLVRAERSQKSAKGVHLQDLALYIDKRREIARYKAEAFRQ